MKQWLAKIRGQWLAGWSAVVFTVGIVSGCTQQTFLAKEVWEEAHIGLMPQKLEDDPCPITTNISKLDAAPATVGMPERPARYLSLQEAIAIALENGSVGNPPVNGNPGGRPNDNLNVYAGAGTLNNQVERLRVLSMLPAAQGAVMEGSVARFDAEWITSMSWTSTDALNGTLNIPGYLGQAPGETAQLQSTLMKAFANGAVANVSFLTDYRNLNNASGNPLAFGTSPEYAVRASIGIEAPLWQNYGTYINQLLPRLPTITGNSLSSNSAQIGYNQHQGTLGSLVDRNTEGILISRLRFDQSRAEFERNVHVLIVNVEIAYWTLYNKYGQLYAYEENLRIIREAWQKANAQFKVGVKNLEREQYYQVLGQFEEFRGERVRSMQEVLDAERLLRGLLGMGVEDGCRLVPVTPPTMSEMRPDWDSSLQDTMNSRPELKLARDNVKYHQYLVEIQKNLLKPDLRAFGRYEPFGDGSTLQGNGTFTDSTGTVQPSNAFKSLASGHLADWQIGLYMNMPLGFRFENAALRLARLELTQSYWFLRDQEERATRYLAEQYQEINHWYRRIQAHHSERLAYGESLKIFGDKVATGKILPIDLTFLQVQRSYSAALVKEYQAISEYNNSMARLEWAKGTILRYNNVHIGEGGLPQVAQVRAVEHEKERTHSIILRDRPDSLSQPGRVCLIKDDAQAPAPLYDSVPEHKDYRSQQEYRSLPENKDNHNDQIPALPEKTTKVLKEEIVPVWTATSGSKNSVIPASASASAPAKQPVFVPVEARKSMPNNPVPVQPSGAAKKDGSIGYVEEQVTPKYKPAAPALPSSGANNSPSPGSVGMQGMPPLPVLPASLPPVPLSNKQ